MSIPSSEDRPDDVIESIPWESLGRLDPPDRRPWYIAGAVVVTVVAISASATRTLWPAPPLEPPTASTSTATVATTAIVQSTQEAPVTVAPVSAPVLSEADLMAVEPAQMDRWVASHAEWFLSELFTLDGSDREGLADLMPAGVSIDSPDPDARSFVESASTRTVTKTGSDRYEVVVLIRLLSSADGTAYVRHAAAAFAVPVGIVDGQPVILDLPSPVDIEVLRGRVPAGEPSAPPAHVADAAVASAETFGTVDPSTVTAQLAGSYWRVSVAVEDAAGVMWPIVVWIDGAGDPVETAPAQP